MIEYSNPWFRVVRQGHHHWIEEPGAQQGAAILPIIGDQVLLLKRRRMAQRGATTWEIPRGYAEPGESALACARRELAEEVGLHVDEADLVRLGSVRPNTAILASQVCLYLVAQPAGCLLHERDDEALALAWMPVSAIPEWMSAGKLEDSFTLAALAYYLVERN